MAFRTTADLVKGVLGKDYDTVNNPDLMPYIRGANAITTRVAACATRRGKTLTAAELQEVETWLAAYRYTLSDPVYREKKTGNASAVYAERSYLEGAIQVDPSGCLKAIVSGKTAGGTWLGKAPSDQTDYVDRS